MSWEEHTLAFVIVLSVYMFNVSDVNWNRLYIYEEKYKFYLWIGN